MVKFMVGVMRFLLYYAFLLAFPAIAAAQSPSSSTKCPVLFSDNFDTRIGSEWIREGGGFHMAKGQLTNSDHQRGTLWLGQKDWTDVVVEVDVTGTGCGDAYTAILLRMQDTFNYVGVIATTEVCVFNNPGGIYVIRNGQTTLINQGGSSGRWRIEAEGEVYRVFVNGRELVSASDPTPNPFTRGSVGISMGVGTLDNFRVCQYVK
jgi:hypothetical protein